MIFNANIKVNFKPGINDPQAISISDAIHNLGFNEISNLSSGKLFSFDINSNSKEKAKDILKKSKLLSPKQRKYLKARFLRGRSVKEIAESNKISKQGVAESISNGLKKLRKELAGTCS